MGRLFTAHAVSEAANLETVLGIASPPVSNGGGNRRVYLHEVRIAPSGADFAADVSVYLTKEFSNTELVTNGAFAADTDWTKGTGWTIAAGVANKVTAATTALEQELLAPVVGDIYQLSYGLTETASGITPSFAGDTAPADAGNGTHKPVLVASSTEATLAFTADATAQVDVDNVSVKQYGSNVSHWLKDVIRSGQVLPYIRSFESKQPYSTNGWSLYATVGGASCLLNVTVVYEVV
jgi:hypothetical protein